MYSELILNVLHENCKRIMSNLGITFEELHQVTKFFVYVQDGVTRCLPWCCEVRFLPLRRRLLPSVLRHSTDMEGQNQAKPRNCKQITL